MNKILVDLKRYREEIELRKNNFDYSLGGKTGFCFIEGDYIIKIYDRPRNKKEITDLSNYRSNRISFPFNYLYSKGYVIGEVMPYFKANTIDDVLNLRTNINFLCGSYIEMKKEIMKFPHIVMYDLWSKNILFSTRNGMYLIDVTDWEESSKNYIYTNTKNLDKALGFLLRLMVFEDGRYFIDMDNNYQILRASNLGKELLSIISSYAKYDYNFMELIEAYKEFVRINYNYDIKTISDMKKYTKIMKFS